MTDLQTALAKAETDAAEARQAIDDQARRRFAEQQQADDDHAAALLASFDDRDRELRDVEKTARREFTEALLATDWAQAWVRARGTRHAREALTSATQSAARRLGDDRRIPDLTYRDPRLFEDILDELERAARLAGADEDDRLTRTEDDTAPVPPVHPDLLAVLDHAPGCPGDRIDRLEHGIACVDCPARHVTPPPPPALPARHTEAYAKLWRLHPYKIAEALDPDDRDNPDLNPLHPAAPSAPPGRTGGRPTP